MTWRAILSAGFAVVLAAVAPAASEERPPEVSRMVAGAELRGAARVDFLTLPLYRAQLWTPEQQSLEQADRFALSLTYKRGFRARSLAKGSVSEIARIEGRPTSAFSDLERALIDCFADVSAEDRITGVSASSDTAAFFVNGVQSCTLTYPNLRDRFFGIWLGSDSRYPEVTARLRGEP